MFIDTNNIEMEREFSVGDIVSYANIKLIHANDNKAPLKVVIAKTLVWLLIISMITGLFFI